MRPSLFRAGVLLLIPGRLRVVGRPALLIRQILPHVGHAQHSRPQLRRGEQLRPGLCTPPPDAGTSRMFAGVV
jgi:hypothetical protein